MRDKNHNLKIILKTLSGFEYKPEITKSGSKLTVTDENGKILHKGEFKSFTANFMRLLYGNMIGGNTTACKSIVNGDVSPDTFPNVKINFAGGQGVQKFGIGVGNSSGAVGNTNYVLGWVSDLTYNSVVVSTPTVVGSTVKLDITREILNSSGSTKTLAEAGLIVGAEGEYDNNILMARDLVAVTLLNNQKSTWTYSITVDFSDLTGGFVKNFLDSLIKQWTQATAHAGFTARISHTSVVFDGKMWVIGGNNATGNLNDVWGEGIQLRTAAIATSDVLGMIVGTSDSAFSATATALGTKIAHGTGAGQLEYGAFPDSTFTEEPDVSGNKTTMTLSRSFTNNSGGNITVKEVGIMSVNGLLCRIVPETPIVIVNGATEVISIQFETEV